MKEFKHSFKAVVIRIVKIGALANNIFINIKKIISG